MKMSFFCIHGSRPLLLIILLFIEHRKQVTAVKCLFWKLHIRKCTQMKFLKLPSFEKFLCASNDIFLKFLWSNLTYLQEKQTSIWTIKSFQSTTQFTTTSICHQQSVKVSDKSHNRLLVVWVRVNRGVLYISLQSNAARNLLILSYGDISTIFLSSSSLRAVYFY